MNRNFVYSLCVFFFFFLCFKPALADHIITVNDTKCNNKTCIAVGFFGWMSRVAAIEMRDSQSGDWQYVGSHSCPCGGPICHGALDKISFDNNVWYAEGSCLKGSPTHSASLSALSYDGQHWQWIEGE